MSQSVKHEERPTARQPLRTPPDEAEYLQGKYGPELALQIAGEYVDQTTASCLDLEAIEHWMAVQRILRSWLL